MDNAITGIFGVGLFLAFIVGLAESIGAVPFIIIVAIIGSMALYDLYESLRDARRSASEAEANSPDRHHV